ncbi:MAG TPA: hypothetical protein VM286_10470 [Candidatus Thermoplasmatota archaeon]|nr:hypothetical protein [Candidatus Thermoplasmatota archaeon]
MKPRAALLAAILCGAAAVALVAADLAFNVEATLEVRGSDGVWRTASSTETQRGYPSIAAPACGEHFRVTIHNGMPWSTSRHVTITASGMTASGVPDTVTILEETWTLGARADRTHEFDVPGSVYDASSQPQGGKPTAGVMVSLGADSTQQLYATACRGGSA